MMIQFYCPNCKNLLELTGEEVRAAEECACPFCDTIIQTADVLEASREIVRKSKRKKWIWAGAGCGALLLLFVGISASLAASWYISKMQKDLGVTAEVKKRLASNERFSEAAAKKAAEVAEKHFNGEKVVVIASGGAKWRSQTNTLAMYVKKHLKNLESEVKGLPYEPSAPDEIQEKEMDPALFNRLFQENPDAAGFIFTIPLPYDPKQFNKITFPEKPNRAKVILLHSEPSLRELRKGIVAAAIMIRPNMKKEEFEKIAPEDLDKAFSERYLCITPENVEQIKARYPGAIRN